MDRIPCPLNGGQQPRRCLEVQQYQTGSGRAQVGSERPSERMRLYSDTARSRCSLRECDCNKQIQSRRYSSDMCFRVQVHGLKRSTFIWHMACDRQCADASFAFTGSLSSSYPSAALRWRVNVVCERVSTRHSLNNPILCT
jgi:hypothetical protein